MKISLIGWILIAFIFLKIIGIFPWGWGIALFPLWVVLALAMLKVIVDSGK